MFILVGAMIAYGLIAMAILKDPGTDSGDLGGYNGSSTGSGAYHQ